MKQLHETNYRVMYYLYLHETDKIIWKGSTQNLINKYYRETDRGLRVRYMLEGNEFIRVVSPWTHHLDVFTHGSNLPDYLMLYSEDSYSYQRILTPEEFIKENHLQPISRKHEELRAYEAKGFRKEPIAGTGATWSYLGLRHPKQAGRRRELSETTEQYGDLYEYYKRKPRKRSKIQLTYWDETSRSNSRSQSWKNSKNLYQWQKNLK